MVALLEPEVALWEAGECHQPARAPKTLFPDRHKAVMDEPKFIFTTALWKDPKSVRQNA